MPRTRQPVRGGAGPDPLVRLPAVLASGSTPGSPRATTSAEFDSMIAKVLAWGRNAEEARARLARALGQTQVILGGRTNKAFLLPYSATGCRRRSLRHRLARPLGTDELLEPRHADIAWSARPSRPTRSSTLFARSSFYADVSGPARSSRRDRPAHRVPLPGAPVRPARLPPARRPIGRRRGRRHRRRRRVVRATSNGASLRRGRRHVCRRLPGRARSTPSRSRALPTPSPGAASGGGRPSPAPAVIVSAVAPGDRAGRRPARGVGEHEDGDGRDRRLPRRVRSASDRPERAGRRRRSLPQLEPVVGRGGVHSRPPRRSRIRPAEPGTATPSPRCAPTFLGYDLDPTAMR